jgi:outer membrane biosynthesis protein TonB
MDRGGSRASPKSLREVLGGRGRPAGQEAQPRSSPAAPPALRLQSTIEFYRAQRRAEQTRLTYALLFALLAHAMLLRMTFGGSAGLPGFDPRWFDRRFEAAELRVALLPRKIALPEPPVPPVPRQAKRRSPPSPPVAAAAPALATVSVPQQMPVAPDRAGDASPALDPAPTVLALPPSEKPVWVVPVPPELSMGTTAQRQEPGLAEAISLEAERRDVARAEAARREAVRRAIGQPLDEDAARRDAAARTSPSLAEAPSIEVARVEAPPIETRPVEPARIEPPSVAPAAKIAAPPEDPEREARLRRLGQQLDEEAERRKTAADARQIAAPLDSYRSPRRYRLFGRGDSNEVIARYAESWSRKIEMNMTLAMIRDAVKLPHTKPLVTVAIRGDGSVESVTFVVSSGVPAIDQAIRQVVESQAPYAVFPPSLALEYDVIEIRRTWHFDVAVRLD